MLTFLRKTRKSLIESNSTRKYILYAIGEIALVVIGILIALQINNWNQDQKNLALEKKLLSELHKDLQLDTAFLNYQLKRVESISRSVVYLLTKPENFELPSGDHMTFAGVYFSQNKKALESINATGLQIPIDDRLRNQIREHYHNAQFLLDLIALEDQDFIEFWSIPVQKSHFHFELIEGRNDFDYDVLPDNYEQTIDSKEFEDFLIKKKIVIRNWKSRYSGIHQSSVECMKAIEEYLST